MLRVITLQGYPLLLFKEHIRAKCVQFKRLICLLNVTVFHLCVCVCGTLLCRGVDTDIKKWPIIFGIIY